MLQVHTDRVVAVSPLAVTVYVERRQGRENAATRYHATSYDESNCHMN